MRYKIILPLLVAGFASLAGSAQAQSPYSYPWCAVHADRSGATSCYFSTYEQCRATIQGIGGSCIRSPYFHGVPR
jgi:Protein of unknown function (DUF3551)